MNSRKTHVEYLKILPEYEGQRVDNFLIARLKSVPKSKIYNILRKGEVRVNKKRTLPSYRLKSGDQLRLPPLVLQDKGKAVPPSEVTCELLQKRILYEDDHILVVNKPAGMSVHVGSTVRIGVIEAIRHLYPKLPHIELAHRLDSETSGCLVLAKKKKILRELHELLRAGKMNKIYWALTQGKWHKHEFQVNLPLHKQFKAGGKHVVQVQKDGKSSLTVFSPLKSYKQATLVEAKLFTGRTHQIRVHAAYHKHPIAGDDRYGSSDFNKLARGLGLRRMFLHARMINFTLPSLNQHFKVVAPLDPELETILKAFDEDYRGENEGKG